jgi:hypothetical protein
LDASEGKEEDHMGAVRWTAKGLIFIGQLLEAEEIENWLEQKGRELIEEKLRRLPAKWLAGRSRAKRRISSDLRNSVERNEAFHTSLKDSLGILPHVVLNVAGHFRSKGPKSLILLKGYKKDIVVCPRGFVRKHYVNIVINELKDSAQLSRYEGFPELFLKRTARQSEQSFFSDIAVGSQVTLPGNTNIIIAVDDDFGWNMDGVDGHYYIGGCDAYGTDLSHKKQRKELLKELATAVKEIKIRLGKLSTKDLTDIVEHLRSQ